MKPRIVMDARMIDHPGIGRYQSSLLEHMISVEPDWKWTLAGNTETLSQFEFSKKAEIRPCDIPIYGYQETLGMRRYFHDADVSHVPHFNAPLIPPRNLVVTLHDLIYLYEPSYQPFPGALYFLRWRLRRIAESASAIIAVSEYTAGDLRKQFPGMRGKISVIPEAANPAIRRDNTGADALMQSLKLKPGFVLYVGSIREHKNVQGLIQAYLRLSGHLRARPDLVLVGRPDRRFSRKHGFDEILRRNPSIRHLQDIDDRTLSALYSRAACLVLPSFHEGFGLPVLEAMACGCPVISSDRSSMPEVAGEAALMFDPSQIDALEGHLYNVLTDQVLRGELAAQGIQQAKKFSWAKAAEETISLYKALL